MTTTTQVRSYAARRGRNSALTQERMRVHFPRRVIPEGRLIAAEAFGVDVPVVLEIGCGHGAAAIAYAAAHPQQGVVAVDVHIPGLARMMAAAEAAGVGNLRVWQGDALLLLEERIGAESLHAVHLFFPDPWPKPRHAKRRFVTAYALGMVHDRLVPDGTFRVATDNERYAAFVLAQRSSPHTEVSTWSRESGPSGGRPTGSRTRGSPPAARSPRSRRGAALFEVSPARPPTASAHATGHREGRCPPAQP